MKSSSALFPVFLLAALAAGCAIEKSENPLSPTLAGPIPGVEISAPKLLEPVANQAISTDKQPISLLIENSWSSGPRPLSLSVEVASDAAFSNKVFAVTNVPLGAGGRTVVQLPEALTSGRAYFWRARAEDGANSGPFSGSATFSIFTPVVIDKPVPLNPVGNVTLSDLTPTFRIANAPRSGPAGRISYVIELADSESFGNRLAIWTFPEQPNQSSLDSPAPLPASRRLFWHARGYDDSAAGPWSDTAVFQTPAPPPPPPPGGGGGTGSGHVPPGPLTEARAEQVVYRTANEFQQLLTVAGADELLRRTIWHLHLAGFQAGRQRNPSGAISSDKLTIFINGGWHVYDIFGLQDPLTVHFIEVPSGCSSDGCSYIPDGGIPD